MRILIFLCILIPFACSPPVVFEQAYPTDQQNLTAIPFSFQGAFICESDSALVIINDQSIILHKTHYFNTKMKYVEENENCKIVDDKMYVSGRLECIPVTIINDTIVRGTYKELDTLFLIQEGSLARLHNGHLVINQEVKNKEWAVSLLSHEFGGDMTYRAITKKTKIKNVKKITRITDITVESDRSPRYKVKPTMIEFNKLLADDKVFIECDYLTRVRLDKPLLN